MSWTQVYAPLGTVFLSALVAAIPVIVLLGALAFLRLKAHVAALLGLGSALLVAVLVYGMPPALAGMAALSGAAYGLFPIGFIVLSAIFVYDITVATGQFEVVKRSIAGLASDRRIQLLLIAFSFGAFIEGAAGFGTPVAICAAMLIGLGFNPLKAAGLALLGNTAPVAFGALGTPVIVLAKVTGLPLDQLSAMVGRQLPLFSLMIPFWLIWVMAGFAGMIEVWPVCLVAGLSFAIPQYLVSNFHGPWIVDIVAGLSSILATVVFLRFWQPKKAWRFADDAVAPVLGPSGTPGLSLGAAAATSKPTGREALKAWMPWIILSVFVFAWGLPSLKAFMNGLSAPELHIPWLDKAVYRTMPVVNKPTAEAAVFTFNWISATGTGLLLSGILSGLLLGLSPRRLASIFWGTLKRVRFSLLTIAAMLAVGFTTRFSGSDSSMGLAFAATGKWFPIFSAMLGWLGVALTGSDTSSNVLFGNLQQVTANQLGLPPVLCAAANSSGGVMGKMIDAQSIVVAGVATGQQGGEGAILRFVFWHSVVLALLVGLLVAFQAYVVPGMVPR